MTIVPEFPLMASPLTDPEEPVVDPLVACGDVPGLLLHAARRAPHRRRHAADADPANAVRPERRKVNIGQAPGTAAWLRRNWAAAHDQGNREVA